MRSVHIAPVPNMRGKKSYRFKCGCCDAQDFRSQESEREARALMLDVKRGRVTDHFLHPVEQAPTG